MGGIGDWVGGNWKDIGLGLLTGGAYNISKGAMGGYGNGGKGGKGQSAKPPDFSSAAHPNTSNPLGGQTWNGNTSAFGFSGGAGDTFNNLIGGMGKASTFDPSQAGQQAQDKMYAALQSRLDPAWQNRQQAFDAQLANQGLTPGSEAYTNASRNFGQQRNDAYSQAAGQAIGLGQQEQAQARANSMLPFAEAGQMMSMLGQQGNTLNNGLGAANAQYGAAQDAQSAANAKKGSAMSGLGAIGGSYFGGPVGGAVGSQVGKNVGSNGKGKGQTGAP